MTTKTAAQVRAEYANKTKTIIERLEALHADDERAAKGMGRTIPPADAMTEREQLRRAFERLDADAMDEMTAWLNESRAALAVARSKPHLDEQSRMVDLMTADQLARQGLDAGSLAQRAGQHLAAGDVRAAAVHLNAAKLAGNGKPVRGLDRLTVAIEEHLDEHVPHRAEAIQAHRTDRLAFAQAAVDRLQTRQLVSLLVDNRAAAARASAQSKMAQYEAAKESGERYEQTVELKPVNAEPGGLGR
jgi:hypothetical protein